MVSIAASVAVAVVIALIAFSILKGMNTELARSRAYTDIIDKAHALNVLTASFKEGSGQSDIPQVKSVHESLSDLLSKMTSVEPGEEAFIGQLQKNNSELGLLIDQLFVTGQGTVSGIENERRNVFASQIWMKVRFISDDTNRLMDMSQSRIISAQGKAGATVILLIIILALTNGIIYFLSGRSIVRAQEALGESEERIRVTLGSIGDAVISTNASGQVTFLNPVAAKLTGWEPGAAAHQPIGNVFRIINEKTRQPAEDVVERVLREGNMVALANHTALIARDGREIPIEDSAAPIMDKDGGVSGVVLVFHDVTERRRAREALRESEEQLRLFIDHAPASLAMFDRSMRYLSASQRWLTGYNLEQTDLTGLSHYEVFPEIPEYWKEVHRRGLAGEVVSADADRFERADGSVQWVRWEVRPWFSATGDVGGIVIFSEDITERQQMLETIESLARFPDENPNPILRISGDGKLLYANRSSTPFLKSLGWKHDETLPGDLRQHTFQALSSGCSKEIELKCEEVVYSLLLVPVSDFGYLNIYGRDITARKRGEEALRESEDRFRTMANAIPQLAWIAEADGYIFWYNQRWYDYTGTTPEQMEGWGWQSVHNPETLPGVLKQWKDSITTGEPFDMVFPLRGADGSFREFLTRVMPVKNANGVVIQWCGTNTDITERKQAEMEREATVEILKIINQSSSIADMVKAATTFFQHESGCEAVGIRLNEGEDFPYSEARGFPEEFIRLESSLCAKDAMGNIIRDSLGSPVIECMCGNVILGRVDLSKPFFSPGGSFWTNSTTRLLAATNDDDRQTRTRNRCNGEGYESVALIPLHLGTERLGLIQLNDLRKGMFSAETIAVWERLADYLAVAVAKYRTDEALKENQSRLDLALKSAQMGVWSLDLIENTRHFDDQVCHLLGIDPAKFTGTTDEFLNAVHPDDRDILKAAMDRTIEQDAPYETEYRALWPNGSVHYIIARAKLFRDELGQPARVDGLIWDITDRKQMEDEVRESEERFRVMADSIPQLAWIAGADGYIYWYNQRWYEYTGTTPEQMEGWGWQSVHDTDALPGVLERWKESIATGKPFDMVFPLRGADGSFRQFLTRVLPVKNSDGEVLQWFGTNTDITEREQMENELRKSRDELELRVLERTAELNRYMAKLEQSNQALQDFASIAAHDMKEPLRKVISFGNMLRQKSGESLGQSGNDYLDRMLNATERMQSLLTGLLDYSRVATRSEPFKEVDLSDLIGEVLSDLEVRIVKTGGEVHVGAFPVISADPTQMRQLFQNLIGNALKFHKEGEKPLVTIQSTAYNQSLRIIVEDNGIGFEEQYLEKIFAPFQRLHGKSSPYEGTGMGLAICKKIVERHGGKITAKSTPDKGSLFVIDLPARQAGL